MTDVLWPPDLAPSAQTWNIIGNAGVFVSPLNGTTRTNGRPGVRMGCTITLPQINGQNRARMQALLAALRDRSNRIYVPDFTYGQRGSFAATELLSNGDFSNGTNGYSAGPESSIAVADRVLRVTRTGPTSSNAYATAAVSAMVQWAPYVFRQFVSAVSSGESPGPTATGNTQVITAATYGADPGMRRAVLLATAAASPTAYLDNAPSTGGYLAGGYYETSFASYTRCFLVDGGQNLLTDSDQFGSAAWSATRATVTANSVAAPDGTTTGDTLGEDGTAANTHFILRTSAVTVASSAMDLSYSVAVKAGTRSWIALQITDGSNAATAYFNVTTGAVGSTAVSTNWTNARSFITSLGGGWWRCHFVVRKSGSQTSITPMLIIGEADGDVTFSGATAASLYVWRATLAQSSVPTRLIQTTTTAVAASAQTASRIYVKGLPASTSGILEAGDVVEIGGQRNVLTARLNSDAAGLGTLICGNSFRAATNDAAIIANTPMCKMLLAPDQIDIETMPGRFSPFTLELVEAIE